jgi:hypothetical protein
MKRPFYKTRGRAMKTVLKQRKWTKEQLLAEGFHYYERKKTVVMARELTTREGEKIIHTEWDTLVALPGYMICYDVSDGKLHKTLDEYKHWPVEPDIFRKTYRKWDDEVHWKPTPPEKHLLELGCRPYYKFAGLWAKKVIEPVYVQTIESLEPVAVPVGAYLTIGIKGEPTSMTEQEFVTRYTPPTIATTGIIGRIMAWLSGSK